MISPGPGGPLALPSELSREELIGIARRDPRLAYTLSKCDLSSGGWQILSVTGRFESDAADQIIPLVQERIANNDFWVRRVQVEVDRPRFALGNGFKPQWDYFNQLHPDISFILEIDSFCRVVLATNFLPLAGLSQSFDCACPLGLVFGCATVLDGQLRMDRALAADEVPTIVTVMFHAARLPLGLYSSCWADASLYCASELGVLCNGPGCVDGQPPKGGQPRG